MAQPKDPKKQGVGVNAVSRSNTPIVLGVVGLIVVIAIIAVIVALTSGGDDESADGPAAVQWQAVTATGTPLPQLTEASGATDPAIGATAPTLSGKTFTGEPVTVAPSEKAKVVMFLAHWCPSCQREVPLLTDWITANKDKYNVDYVGVATGTQATAANFPPSAWLAEENFPAPTMADDRNNAAASAYGLSSYPYFVFLDKNNKVISRTSGELPMADFERYVSAAAAAS